MSVDMTKWCEIAKANMGKRPVSQVEANSSVPHSCILINIRM